jgi:hypothetical protein
MMRDVLKKTVHPIIKLILIILLCLNIIDLTRFAFDYHLFVKSDKVLKSPEVTRSISHDGYYITIDPYTSWNDVFLKKGWQSPKETDLYLFMKNFLYPNSNLIFDRSSYAINTGAFHLRRPEYVKSLIERSIWKESQTVTPYIKNLLEIIEINTIVSGIPLKGEALKEKEILSMDEVKIYIYEVIGSKPGWYYVPKKIEDIEYIDDFERRLMKDEISLQTSVVEGIHTRQNNDRYSISNEKSGNTQYELRGNFSQDTFVAFRINYYPEWSVFIDDKKTRIYKTNMTQMGVIVPKGEHTVIIRYENVYFKIGIAISLFVAAAYSILLLKSKRF